MVSISSVVQSILSCGATITSSSIHFPDTKQFVNYLPFVSNWVTPHRAYQLQLILHCALLKRVESF